VRKLKMQLLELVVLFAPENRRFNGTRLRKKREVMERYSLSKEDLERIREALAAGRYRLSYRRDGA